MGKQLNNLLIHVGLLISGSATVFSGLLIQVEYHMGHHEINTINDAVFGISYFGWSDIHKVSIVLLSAFMIFHISRHWKLYKVIGKKKVVAKNRQVLTLSVVFVLVAITGLIPWSIDLMNGGELQRKAFIEIHDKLAIILSIYLILHIIRRLKFIIPESKLFLPVAKRT
jgi:hypothetical protein